MRSSFPDHFKTFWLLSWDRAEMFETIFSFFGISLEFLQPNSAPLRVLGCLDEPHASPSAISRRHREALRAFSSSVSFLLLLLRVSAWCGWIFPAESSVEGSRSGGTRRERERERCLANAALSVFSCSLVWRTGQERTSEEGGLKKRAA